MEKPRKENADDNISLFQAREQTERFFEQYDCKNKRIILIIPDGSRSGPVGEIFKIVFDCIGHKTKSLDILVALGTHQPMSEEQICTRLTMSAKERETKYKSVKFFNHEWEKPETFTSIGEISETEVSKISGGLFKERVNVAINKLIFDYNEFFILGPVFPHEVVGFSGGHKYLFPGISASEIIDFFHWLGAVITNPQINGEMWTPTRQVVEKAASLVSVPHKLIALVAVGNNLKGLFIGDPIEAWKSAASLSKRIHLIYKNKPYNTVLGIAPQMYEDIWTAGKVMYKLEPIVADGGTLIIYAPHITEISYSHGKILDQIGYHVRDYFLKQMEKFRGIPRGVIAHSTHVKGIGTYSKGVESPRVNVILATNISKERCKKVNLGYMDPHNISIEDYEKKQDALVVHHAGEILHRLIDGSIPTIPKE